MTSENPEQPAGPHEGADQAQEGSEQSFVFHDKRRIDPETGQVRDGETAADGSAPVDDEAAPGAADPAGAQSTADGTADEAPVEADATAAADVEAEVAAAGDVSAEAARYLDDLQRLNAEYAAYRRRTERDQAKAKEAGAVGLVEALVPVLDEVKLAAENGDVTGPFETHVNKLVEALGKAGVEQYGAPGDVFDPAIHEALMQQPSEAVEEPTVFLVMQPGYKVGDRVVRAARVGVHVPED